MSLGSRMEHIDFNPCSRKSCLLYTYDECWLDISGTDYAFGSPEKVANDIRETIKFELGLTISVGVSFNKIFAKLGSDMKQRCV